MNNIVKSVVFAAVVLFAGIAAMQVIYKNQDMSSDITAVEPAAGDMVAPAPEGAAMDTTPVNDAVVPSDAAVDAQKEAIDAEAEAAKEAVDANVEAAKDEAKAAEESADAAADAVEEGADAQKEAIDAEAEAAKDAVEEHKDEAEKAHGAH
jgi:hypothetical protein